MRQAVVPRPPDNLKPLERVGHHVQVHAQKPIVRCDPGMPAAVRGDLQRRTAAHGGEEAGTGQDDGRAEIAPGSRQASDDSTASHDEAAHDLENAGNPEIP